jgi:hypothetical protein
LSPVCQPQTPKKYSTTRIFNAQNQPAPTIPTNTSAGSATAIKAKSFRVLYPPGRTIRKRIGLDCIQRALHIVRLQRRDIRITARICIGFDQRLRIVSPPPFSAELSPASSRKRQHKMFKLSNYTTEISTKWRRTITNEIHRRIHTHPLPTHRKLFPLPKPQSRPVAPTSRMDTLSHSTLLRTNGFHRRSTHSRRFRRSKYPRRYRALRIYDQHFHDSAP